MKTEILKGKRVAVSMAGVVYRGTLAEVSEDWWTLKLDEGNDLHMRPGQVEAIQELKAKPQVVG